MKRFSLVLSFFLTMSMAFGQSRTGQQIEYSGFFDTYYYRGPLSFTLTGEVNNYFGDLCSGFNCSNRPFNVGVGAHYKLWPRTLFGLDLNWLKLQSADADASRNLAFKSSNFQVQAYGRFELIQRRILKHSERKLLPKKVKPYVYAGLSYSRYKTSSFADGPGTGQTLPLEEKVYPYSLWTFPTGLGFRYSFGWRLTMAIQGVYHFTLTDYLDDVSVVRGGDDKKDKYAEFKIIVSYAPWGKRIKPKKRKVVERDEEEGGTTSPNTNNGGGGSSAAPAEKKEVTPTPAPEPSPTPDEEEVQPSDDNDSEPVEEIIEEDNLDEEQFEEDTTDDSNEGGDNWGW